jgi:hypothetical protein
MIFINYLIFMLFFIFMILIHLFSIHLFIYNFYKKFIIILILYFDNFFGFMNIMINYFLIEFIV